MNRTIFNDTQHTNSNSDDGDTSDVNNDVESDDLDNHHGLMRTMTMIIFIGKSDDNDEDNDPQYHYFHFHGDHDDNNVSQYLTVVCMTIRVFHTNVV